METFFLIQLKNLKKFSEMVCMYGSQISNFVPTGCAEWFHLYSLCYESCGAIMGKWTCVKKWGNTAVQGPQSQTPT